MSCRRRRRDGGLFLKKYKNEILDESYLEQRSEFSGFAVALRILLRFFLDIPPKVHSSVNISLV